MDRINPATNNAIAALDSPNALISWLTIRSAAPLSVMAIPNTDAIAITNDTLPAVTPNSFMLVSTAATHALPSPTWGDNIPTMTAPKISDIYAGNLSATMNNTTQSVPNKRISKGA